MGVVNLPSAQSCSCQDRMPALGPATGSLPVAPTQLFPLHLVKPDTSQAVVRQHILLNSTASRVLLEQTNGHSSWPAWLQQRHAPWAFWCSPVQRTSYPLLSQPLET